MSHHPRQPPPSGTASPQASPPPGATTTDQGAADTSRPSPPNVRGAAHNHPTADFSRDEKTCAGPDCTNTLSRNPRGRPALYCSPACRNATYRKGHPATNLPVTVEVDHGSTSAKQRPTGRIWLVRLRRGHRTVIIATGLGKPSADYLADQVTDLLRQQPVATGGAIE